MIVKVILAPINNAYFLGQSNNDIMKFSRAVKTKLSAVTLYVALAKQAQFNSLATLTQYWR